MDKVVIVPNSLYKNSEGRVFYMYGACENTSTGEEMASYTSGDSTPPCVKAYVTPLKDFKLVRMTKSEVDEFVSSLPEELAIYYTNVNTD